MSRKQPHWGHVALLLLTGLLRFWELGSQSLWYDEAYTWWMATQVSVADSIASSVHEIIPPFSYFLWRGWAALVGESEFALRMASALLGVLAVAASGRIVWRLTRRRVAVTAALLLFAVAPPLLWASREVRMYGPLLTLTMLANMALLETLLGPPEHRFRWAWLWGLTTLLALCTLVLAGFWLMGQGLFAVLVSAFPHVVRRISQKPDAPGMGMRGFYAHLKPLILPGIAVVILYLPWVLVASRSLGVNRGYWPGYLPPSAFFRTTLQGITVFDYLPDTIALTAAAGVLFAFFLALLLSLRCVPAWLYPLCYGLPLIPLSYIYRTIPKWGLRHGVIFAPGLYLALALAWGGVLRLSRRFWRRAAMAVLGVVSLAACVPLLLADAAMLRDPAYAHEDWRGVAAYVCEQRALTPDEKTVIIIETGSVFPTWAYYDTLEGVFPLPDETLLDVFNVLHYVNTAPALENALQGVRHVWLVTWLADVSDPTAIVPTLLGRVGQERPVPEFHGLGVRHFVLDGVPEFTPEPPSVAHPDAELLPDLRLWGYDYPETLSSGAMFDVLTWWVVDDPAAHVARFYQASLRLQDADGFTWVTLDEPPGGGDYRPERWTPGTSVLGRFEMQLPAGLAAGTYTATLILYEGDAKAAFPLGQVHVTRSVSPPAIPEGMTPVAATSGDAPLRLLAVRLDEGAVEPCATLGGRLFWEVQSWNAQPYTLHVALDAEQAQQLLLPEYSFEGWQPGDRFLSRFALPLGCRAPDVTTAMNVALLAEDASVLATWRGPDVVVSAGRQFTLPTGVLPVEPVVASDLAILEGYALEPATLSSGTPLTITLYWRVLTTTDIPYTSFAHVTPSDAPTPVVVQHDAWPVMGTRPTFTWLAGEIIADVHPLNPLPPGMYQVRVGFYDPDSVRLPLRLEGVALPDDICALPVTLSVSD